MSLLPDIDSDFVAPLVQPDAVTGVSWSADARHIVVQSRLGRITTVWHVASRKVVWRVEHDIALCFDAVMLPDGRSVVTTTNSRRPLSGHTALDVWDIEVGEVTQHVEGPYLSEGSVFNAAHRFTLSPDGQKLAVITYQEPGRVVAVYNTNTWRIESRIPLIGDTASALCFSSDGELVCIGTIGGTVHLLNVDLSKVVQKLDIFKEEYMGVESMCLDQDSKKLICAPTVSYATSRSHPRKATDACGAGSIRVWDVAEARLHAAMFDSDSIIRSLVPLDPHHFASGGDGGNLCVWNSRTCSVISQRRLAGTVMAMSLSPDKSLLAVANGHTVYIVGHQSS